MGRKLYVVLTTTLAFGLILGFGISCSEYFFAAYPDIEVRACALGACDASVEPALPGEVKNPTNALFADPGLTKNPGDPRYEKLSLRIYNSGEGTLVVQAPSVNDLVPINSTDACTFGIEVPENHQAGEPCPSGSNACVCLADKEAQGTLGNCSPTRAAGIQGWLHLEAGGYADYVLTYYYDEMHEGCQRTLTLDNTDPDEAALVGTENAESPWTVILDGGRACSIDITPVGAAAPGPYQFGSNVEGRTLGHQLEMRVSDNCEVRLVGMRIIDAAATDPQQNQRGGLGSLCVGPDDSGSPVAQSETCADNNCYMGGAGVARCVAPCTGDAECGNGMKCLDSLCWPQAPYEQAGRGGGSDMAATYFSTREDPTGQPSFPKTLKWHQDDDPDGWITTTFTCSDQPSANREARVEVLFDLEDNRPRAAYGTLEGVCGECPVAVVAVTEPPVGEVKPLDTVILDGTGSSSPSGKQISYKWYFNQAPADSHTGYRPECNAGATNTLESCSTSAQPQFFVDLAGKYEPCLEICETGGACTSDPECGGDKCQLIDATPREAVHVQLVWDHPETDVDLHYIRDGAVYGDRLQDNPGGDCHFFNPHPDYCIALDDSDDPSLDIDDVRGYGPENTNHNDPCDGEYRIWATYYEDKGLGSTRAKVRVFIKGQQAAEESHVLDKRNCHWLVGKVIWSGDNGTFEVATNNNYVCNVGNPEQ